MENKQTLEEAANKANGYNVYAKETKAPIFNEGFIAGAKWQAERMYSEGEVLNLLRKAHFVEQNIDEWFEQFKKK